MTWVFGYGSLVWRPAFPFRASSPATLTGYQRRFWQGSPDHRGTPEAPGRVVTLVESSASRVWGRVYELDPASERETLLALEVREQAGYEQQILPVELSTGDVVHALVYIGGPENPSYLGPAPLEDIAAEVRLRVGPSGPNVEYVTRLAEALLDMGADEDDATRLARLIQGDFRI